MAGHRVETVEELRAIYGAVMGRAAAKAIPKLDKHCRHIIALSPFLIISSAGADGSADVSPKGDGPGFVHVIDDSTIAIPDRPGNRRIDTLTNIIENPDVAAIFLVPGIRETLRVNGKAEISTDPGLLDRMAVKGKRPITAIVIHVEETFLHCAKCIIRSSLWDPAHHVPQADVPSLNKMLADQLNMEIDLKKADEQLEKAYQETLY